MKVRHLKAVPAAPFTGFSNLNWTYSELPFKDVNKELAYIEGEGDKSLEYWRRVHIKFLQWNAKSME